MHISKRGARVKRDHCILSAFRVPTNTIADTDWALNGQMHSLLVNLDDKCAMREGDPTIIYHLMLLGLMYVNVASTDN